MGEKQKQGTEKDKTKSLSKNVDSKPSAKDEGKKGKTATSSSSVKKSSRTLSTTCDKVAAPKSSKKLLTVTSTPTKKKQDDTVLSDKDKKKKPNKEKENSKDETKKSTKTKDDGERKKKSSTTDKKEDKKKEELKKDTAKKEKIKEKDKKKEKDVKKAKKSDTNDGENGKKDKKKTKSDTKNKKVGKKRSKDDENKKGKTLACCICKDGNIKDDLAGGLCDHVFCTPCLENLLHKPMIDPKPDDNHLSAPTLGRCPECHAALKKFEMKDMSSSGKRKKGSEKFMAEKITDIGQTPIKGLVFQPDLDTKQWGYFHFDSDDDPKKSKIRPRLDFSKAISQDREAWLMNDGTTVPDQKYFEKGYFYHESTRTFHGTIIWDTITFQGSHQWDCVIGFNKSFSAIHVGVIHERKERILDKKAQEKADKAKDSEVYRYQYPFDGRWKLLWKNTEGKDQTGTITVRNNEFQQGPYLFNINFKDPETPRFRWPLDPVYAAVKRGGNVKKKPMGPDIGERVVWETTHPAFAEITWERETIGDPPIQKTTHFGIGNHEYSVWSSWADEAGELENDTPSRDVVDNQSDSDDDGDVAEEKVGELGNESDDDSSSSSGSSSSSSDSGDDDESDSSSSSGS
jgi:hypothetical protein